EANPNPGLMPYSFAQRDSHGRLERGRKSRWDAIGRIDHMTGKYDHRRNREVLLNVRSIVLPMLKNQTRIAPGGTDITKTPRALFCRTPIPLLRLSPVAQNQRRFCHGCANPVFVDISA